MKKSFKDLKQFIRKTAMFLGVFVVMIIYVNYLFFTSSHGFSNKKRQIDEKIESVDVLVFGSSHSYNAINPAQFKSLGYNMGNPGQDLYYDTELLWKYLPQARKLKLVIFEVSYHTLGYKIIQKDENFRALFYRQQFGIPLESMTPKDAIYLTKSTFNSQRNLIKSRFLLRQSRSQSVSDTDNEYGFRPVNETLFKDGQTGRERIQYHHLLISKDNYQENAMYLIKTSGLLQQRGIKVVIVNPPVFKTYSDSFDQEIYQKNRDVLDGLISKYHVINYDFTYDARFGEDDFYNDDHLNAKGAIKFSTFVDQKINEIFVNF